MYAVVDIGGKQYKVQEGEIIKVEKLNANVGDEVEFKDVLMIRKNEDIEVGSLKKLNTKVVGKVLSQEKDKKIVVFKYKPKKNYRREKGHRQYITKVMIKEIKVA